MAKYQEAYGEIPNQFGADAYDAMTADRPYHKGISEAAALVEIQKGAGTQFDPLLAEVFVQAISKWTNAVSL